MNKTWTMLLAMGALAAVACEEQHEPPRTTATPSPPRDVDNSAVNTRDRDQNAMTADQAGQSSGEVDLAAQIRKRITDTQMSVNAQNVKVIVQGTKVQLRGPVKSQEEKDALARIAAEVAGAGNVDNQLEVETSP